MSSISPEVEAEEDGQVAVQGLPSVDSIFVADSQVQSPGSQPGGSFSVWRSFYNVALRSFFWSSTKCLIYPMAQSPAPGDAGCCPGVPQSGCHSQR